MTDPCTIVIGALDVLPALKERASSMNGEVIAFADAEALRALEAIHKRKPSVVALHRVFAVSPRGAALINRIKADPALAGSELRVVSHDSDYARVVPRAAGDEPPQRHDELGRPAALAFHRPANVDDDNVAGRTLVELHRGYALWRCA